MKSSLFLIAATIKPHLQRYVNTFPVSYKTENEAQKTKLTKKIDEQVIFEATNRLKSGEG